MIKVGIVGCDHQRSAELVRLLINHPDVALMWATATSCEAGTRLDSIVPGIVGECDLVVAADADFAAVDLVYLCGSRADVSAWLSSMSIPDSVGVIDLSGSHNQDAGDGTLWKYGLSEMQRRLLVHDTRLITVPGNAAIAALIALMPMARNLMLNHPLSLRVTLGELAFPLDGKTLDGFSAEEWARDQQREVVRALGQCQSSFNQPVELTVGTHAHRRALAVEARFKCGVDIEMVQQLYEQYYKDHNFVFIVNRPITIADVENTNKCLIGLDMDERSGELAVQGMMDLMLKGSAGTAVHAMNLMFGLHERVGLALKGSGC